LIFGSSWIEERVKLLIGIVVKLVSDGVEGQKKCRSL